MKNKTEIASVHVIQLWPLDSEGLAWDGMQIAMEEVEQRETKANENETEAREGCL